MWGWTWRVQVIDIATGTVVTDEPECFAFSLADGPPGPGPVGATPPTIGEIWRTVHIPDPPLELSPPDDGVTGLATWMWSSSPELDHDRCDARRLDGARCRSSHRIRVRRR